MRHCQTNMNCPTTFLPFPTFLYPECTAPPRIPLATLDTLKHNKEGFLPTDCSGPVKSSLPQNLKPKLRALKQETETHQQAKTPNPHKRKPQRQAQHGGLQQPSPIKPPRQPHLPHVLAIAPSRTVMDPTGQALPLPQPRHRPHGKGATSARLRQPLNRRGEHPTALKLHARRGSQLQLLARLLCSFLGVGGRWLPQRLGGFWAPRGAPRPLYICFYCCCS